MFLSFFSQNICYGQTKELNCEHCHSKLSILADSAGSSTFSHAPAKQVRGFP